MSSIESLLKKKSALQGTKAKQLRKLSRHRSPSRNYTICLNVLDQINEALMNIEVLIKLEEKSNEKQGHQYEAF
jgi:hypothetical protein